MGSRTPLVCLLGILSTCSTTMAAELFVCGELSNSVERYDATTGTHLGSAVPSGAGGLALPSGFFIEPDGRLVVASAQSNTLLRFDPQTQALVGVVALGPPLNQPTALCAGPSGTTLFVANAGDGAILRYATDGAFLGTVTTVAGVSAVNLQPNDELVVGDAGDDRVAIYDVQDGGLLRNLVWDDPQTPIDESEGLAAPRGFCMTPDTILVCSFATDEVLEYDGATGDYLRTFASTNLQQPTDLALSADGTLYVCSYGTSSVVRFDYATAAEIDVVVPPFAGLLAGPVAIRIVNDEPATVPGDLNCDGTVSVGDINGFVLALTDPDGYAKQFPDCNIRNADISNDGNVSVADINGFVALLVGS